MKESSQKRKCGGTFDRIFLNEGDGATDAGSYGNLWILKGVFSGRLGLGLTMGKRDPRDKHAGFH